MLMRSLLLAPCLLVAALQPAGQTPASALYGVWDGTLAIKQAGRCSTNGVSERSEEVRVVIRPGDDGKPQAGFTLLPALVDVDDNLKVGLKRDRVRLELSKMGVCGATPPHKYSVKWDGPWPAEADGERTLSLAGMDVPCAEGGCRFKNTLTLQWKRALAP
jgi:hypothetical protein